MGHLSLDLIPAGTQLPPDLPAVTGDAAKAIDRIADAQKRAAMADRLGQTLHGAWTVIVVRHSSRPAGLAAVRPAGDNAQLVFGHILSAHRGEEKEILEALIILLRGHGYKVIRSIFAWPEPEAFMEAAPAAGFTRLDRMDMVRENAGRPATRNASGSFEIARWSQVYFDDVARIMFDNYYPEDRIANPLANTIEGCGTHLQNIINDSYGKFAQGRSFVAVCEGRPAGYLLISALPQDSALVVELARFSGSGVSGGNAWNVFASTTSGCGSKLMTTHRTPRARAAAWARDRIAR
jgi:hypothetical protein